MKLRPIACLAAAILSAMQISCTPMIENDRDHRHDPKFKEKNESRNSGG
jgi:hypothetical protein